jgi:hypothetical protein
MKKLDFGFGNAKLSKSIATFSLPAGHSCPWAKECHSQADRVTGKIIDGKHCRYRCFSASNETAFPTVRKSRWKNFDLLQEASTIDKMSSLINDSLPSEIKTVRVHVSGDHFNEKYFLSWINVAYNNPSSIFYGYTKATPFLVNYKKDIPPNFRFTASKGGTCDNLIAKHKLKYAEVVFSLDEAKQKNLEIDHDDSHAISSKKSFGLLLHGTQPIGSEASKALSILRKQGLGSYNRNKPKEDLQQIAKPFKMYFAKPFKFVPTKKKELIIYPS